MHSQKPVSSDEWIAAARTGGTFVPDEEKPWLQFDPREPAVGNAFKLRLNRYQRALLEYVAAREYGSMHSCILRILVAGLETAAAGPPEMDIRLVADIREREP